MKLLVFDGNSIINRAFYAIRTLTTREGVPTNAIYGFIQIFQKAVEEERPDVTCVAFDLPGPTFRHKAYTGYKAQRKGMPDELAAQMPLLKQWLDLMGVPRLECAGYEADDIIGTLASQCDASNRDCVIVTGDRDDLQLVSEQVTVKLTVTRMGKTESIRCTPEQVMEDYGFAPARIVDYKAIAGDSSDNIPGVAGIGDKGAKTLIQAFGDLDGIYQNIDDASIKKGMREKLIAGRDMAYLSKELATICREAPIDRGAGDLEMGARDTAGLLAFYTTYELRTLAAKLQAESGADEAARTQPDIPEPEELTSALAVMDAAGATVAIDDSAEGIALAFDGRLCFAPAGAEGYDAIRRTVLELPAQKILHDGKSLMTLCGREQIQLSHICFDTYLAAYLLNPSASRYTVPLLAAEYLGADLPDTPAARAWALTKLMPVLREKLREEGTENLYDTIELPLARVLSEMELVGMRIDAEKLAAFGEALTGRIEAAEAAVYDMAGTEFNIGSPKQLGEVLFEQLGLPAGKKTKTGYSTGAEVLERLRKYHPIIDHILDYRMYTKLKSTYADGLLKVCDPADGRIHSTFNQTVTQTGRISSTEPNLQNIPVRGEQGREIRRLFIPAEGCVLLDADYSQIELRVLAHIAQDENMIDAFLSGEDIHTVTASQVFGVPPAEVTPELRRRAKAVNFGIVYGISDFSLAGDIGVTRKEAAAYIEGYFAHYPGIRRYLTETVARAKEDGYVTTIFGRRRYLPEIKSSNYNIRSFGERVAMNTPIQGAAADIIKIAMIRVSDALREGGFRARLILQVHDELIVEAPLEEKDAVAALLQREMEGAADLRAPLIAEVHAGMSWLDAK